MNENVNQGEPHVQRNKQGNFDRKQRIGTGDPVYVGRRCGDQYYACDQRVMELTVTPGRNKSEQSGTALYSLTSSPMLPGSICRKAVRSISKDRYAPANGRIRTGGIGTRPRLSPRNWKCLMVDKLSRIFRSQSGQMIKNQEWKIHLMSTISVLSAIQSEVYQ